MRNEELVLAAQYIENYCAEKACPNCCIRKLCNACDKNLPLADQIRRVAEREN